MPPASKAHGWGLVWLGALLLSASFIYAFYSCLIAICEFPEFFPLWNRVCNFFILLFLIAHGFIQIYYLTNCNVLRKRTKAFLSDFLSFFLFQFHKRKFSKAYIFSIQFSTESVFIASGNSCVIAFSYFGTSPLLGHKEAVFHFVILLRLLIWWNIYLFALYFYVYVHVCFCTMFIQCPQRP